MTDITGINRMLEAKAREVAEYLLPAGILEGREWCVGSINGEAGKSLKICTQGSKRGRWSDFAEGGESGDMLDLWGAVRHISLVETLKEVRSWLGIEEPTFEKRTKVWRRPERPQSTRPKSAVLDYLTNTRALSSDAIRVYQIGEQDRTIIFPSFSEDGSLAFVKYLGIDRKDGKKNIRVEADCEPVLFGWPVISADAREVVLVEGEIDALASYDYGHPALSVPFGGGAGDKQRWIETDYERLLRFEVIYLALDMDEPGEIAAADIANRLGRHRCRRVKLPLKDFDECLKAGTSQQDIDRCFSEAKTLDPPELRRAGEYADEVMALFFPEQGAAEAGYHLPFGKIGRDLLFRPGEVTLWSGATGEGKSLLLSHAIVSFGDQGAKVCIASLEMKPSQTLKRMVKQAGNVDRPTDHYGRKIIRWLDEWVWVFAVVGSRPVARLLEVFEYARARYGCDTFVIDSFMRLGIGPDDYAKQDKAMLEIVNWTVEKNVHMHLVAHARKADSHGTGIPESADVKGTSEIGANAFNIITVWRNRKLEAEIKELEGSDSSDSALTAKLRDIVDKPTVVANIAKQRNGDYEGKCGLWLNQATYQYRSSEDSRDGVRYVKGDNEYMPSPEPEAPKDWYNN